MARRPASPVAAPPAHAPASSHPLPPASSSYSSSSPAAAARPSGARLKRPHRIALGVAAFALLANPLSVLLIVAFAVGTYAAAIAAVVAFAAVLAFRDFILVELRPYLDDEAIRFLEQDPTARLWPSATSPSSEPSVPVNGIAPAPYVIAAGRAASPHLQHGIVTAAAPASSAPASSAPASLPISPPVSPSSPSAASAFSESPAVKRLTTRLPILTHPIVTNTLLAGPLMAYVSTRIVVHSSLKGTKVVLTYAIKATPAAIAAMQSLYTASVRRIKWAQGWMHFVFSSLFTALAHRLQPLLVWAQDRLVRAVDATIAFVVTYGPRAWIALKRSVRPTYRAFLRAAVAIRLWTVWFHELYIEPFIERVKHVAVRAWPTLKAGLVAVFHACVDLDRQMRPYVIKGLRTVRDVAQWALLVTGVVTALAFDILSKIAQPFVAVSQSLLTLARTASVSAIDVIHRTLPALRAQLAVMARSIAHETHELALYLIAAARPTAIAVWVQIRAVAAVLPGALRAFALYIHRHGERLGVWTYLRSLPSRAAVVASHLSQRAAVFLFAAALRTRLLAIQLYADAKPMLDHAVAWARQMSGPAKLAAVQTYARAVELTQYIVAVYVVPLPAILAALVSRIREIQVQLLLQLRSILKQWQTL